ncbi:unnamed protein product (macronuclear) [Paramecium tetraurelia]|uniref:Pinin/SDK/MemA protein domain-containing protein n=1 Tax=Paramecium tetraurelia TaxID=5888 RepID=A0BP02_PARTE|nr:uncharacterized protein GSPATT00030908001 [Paramecium tetraurelia]CAK60269.1 unnamed protein product [Paramecium tetraurelia]|eukprot:XP_001427667.1 hypothetical protein (macronuclear) [Paramecium tetraurelia strain d4-2]
MSSQSEESDVQDDIIHDYTSNYTSDKSSQQPYQESHDDVYEKVQDDEVNYVRKSEENDSHQRQESPSSKQISQANPPKTAEDEETVKSCMEQASRINEKIMNQRKQLKDQFKEFQNTMNAARSNLKDFDMPYQTAHFPLYLKTQEKFVILPAQNLNIRKGTLESFIKTNLENENSVKKAEQDKRVAFKQRRPYQKRKFDS